MKCVLWWAATSYFFFHTRYWRFAGAAKKNLVKWLIWKWKVWFGNLIGIACDPMAVALWNFDGIAELKLQNRWLKTKQKKNERKKIYCLPYTPHKWTHRNGIPPPVRRTLYIVGSSEKLTIISIKRNWPFRYARWKLQINSIAYLFMVWWPFICLSN